MIAELSGGLSFAYLVRAKFPFRADCCRVRRPRALGDAGEPDWRGEDLERMGCKGKTSKSLYQRPVDLAPGCAV